MEEEKNNNKASFGIKLLCFLIPLVGLILFIAKKKEKPEYAKGCGISALIGFIVSMVLSIILTIVILVVLPTMVIGGAVVSNVNDAISTVDFTSAEIQTFNLQFKIYEGNIKGTKVKQLIETVNINNRKYVDDASMQVTIKLDGVSSKTSTITASQVKAGYSYTVKCNYDSNGRVNEVIINSESSSSNTTNTITNSIDTFTNTLDNSVGTFTNSIDSSAGTFTNTLENSIDTLSNSLTDAAGAFSNVLSSFGL